jgi:hypothetical protein
MPASISKGSLNCPTPSSMSLLGTLPRVPGFRDPPAQNIQLLYKVPGCVLSLSRDRSQETL